MNDGEVEQADQYRNHRQIIFPSRQASDQFEWMRIDDISAHWYPVLLPVNLTQKGHIFKTEWVSTAISNSVPTWRQMKMTLEAARSEPHSNKKTKPFGVRGVSSTASSQKAISLFAYRSSCVIWYKLIWAIVSQIWITRPFICLQWLTSAPEILASQLNPLDQCKPYSFTRFSASIR